MTEEAKWYAIYIGDSKRYPVVDNAFRAANIEHTLWVPKQNVLQKFRGRDTIKPRVFIPGYIFVKFVYKPGIIEDKIDTVGGYFLSPPGSYIPEPLDNTFIERVKSFENQEQDIDLVKNTYNLKVGDVVEVLNGPFLSALGPIKVIKKGQIFVELDIMNRPVEVGLDPRQCLKVSLDEKEKINTG